MRLVQVREAAPAEISMFYKYWGMIILLYLAVQMLTNYGIRCYLIHKIEK